MTKRWKVILGILTVVIILIGIFVLANIDTIMMIKDGVIESTETIATKKEKVKNKEKETLEKAGIVNVRPLTEEETDEFNSGNISEDDAIKLILGKTTIEKVKESKVNEKGKPEKNSDKTDSNTNSTDKSGDGLTKNETSEDKNKPSGGGQQGVSGKPGSTDSSKPSENSKPGSGEDGNKDQQQMTQQETRIAELIGQIYVLEAKFTSELGKLEAWACNEYNITPKDKKKEKKKELADIGFPKLSALEKECDTKVESILSELSQILETTGQDMALVKQIRDSYNDKKQLTKSYYISEYL